MSSFPETIYITSEDLAGHEVTTFVYDELNPHPDTSKSPRPDWLRVCQEDDSCPWDPSCHWTTMTVCDVESLTWVFRRDSTGEVSIGSEDQLHLPTDPVRIATMFLVFAEEEEALNES